ncbi:MAG: flagellar biosynthesis anti-sigma factor FlgM [Sphingomonadaceae bacterium]
MTARNEINSVAADLSSKPPVDSDKVERLRASIGAGHYPLDPARIADAMIGQELTFR